MRKLGIDYGDSRVGIAITDALNITDKAVSKSIVSSTQQRANAKTSNTPSKRGKPIIKIILLI